MINIQKILCMIMVGTFVACSHKQGHLHNQAQQHMHAHNFEDLVKNFDNPERDAWQKPAEIVKFVQEKYFKKNKKKSFKDAALADLGAGTGYFAFRFLEAGARVIALDIDERFLNHMRQKAVQYPQKKNFEARITDANSANLNMNEAEIVISVNVYHHLENRIEYFKKLKRFLRKNGFLVIIDFKEGDLPMGPPASMKIATADVVSELKAAGFKVSVESNLLPHQHIFVAE